MRTNISNRFAGILIALTVTAGSAVSSNIFEGRGRNNNATAVCVNQISGLSQDQKDRMTALITQHQSAIDDLREKRRSTTDIAQKDQIRKQMDTQVESHRNAVRTILNADQQKQYDQISKNIGGNRGNLQYRNCRRNLNQSSVRGYGRGYGGRGWQ